MLLSCNDTLDLDARWNPELARVGSELVLYGTFHEKCWVFLVGKWKFRSNNPDLCQFQSFVFGEHVAQTFSFLI